MHPEMSDISLEDSHSTQLMMDVVCSVPNLQLRGAFGMTETIVHSSQMHQTASNTIESDAKHQDSHSQPIGIASFTVELTAYM